MMTTRAQMEDRLDPEKIHFIDVDGIRTRYYEAGTGEPLILMHGGHFGSRCSLDCWSLNLRGLAEHFHVYAWDKLGQGYTDNPSREEDYTFEALFHHTCALIEALGITGAHVLGHSRGALLAAWFALEQPLKVKTVTLVSTNTLAPADPEFTCTLYADVDRRIPPGAPSRATARMEADANSYSSDHVTEDYVTRLLDICLLPKAQAADHLIKTLGSSLLYPSLDRTRAAALNRIDQVGLPGPTLVVWGQNDPSAPLHLGLKLFPRICVRTPQAQLHVFNRAGHYVYREHPEAFNRLIQTFCLSVAAPERQ